MNLALLFAVMTPAGGAWRRALGGWGALRRPVLVGLAWAPAAPLLPLVDGTAWALMVAATYAHFLPSHFGMIDAGRATHTAWRDAAMLALRYTAGPAVLALGMLPGLELLPDARPWIGLIGPLTAAGYALAWECSDRGWLPARIEPTAVGEVVMGATWYGALALVGGA